jgi:N12 class adenine-specific DNA methylase
MIEKALCHGLTTLFNVFSCIVARNPKNVMVKAISLGISAVSTSHQGNHFKWARYNLQAHQATMNAKEARGGTGIVHITGILLQNVR